MIVFLIGFAAGAIVVGIFGKKIKTILLTEEAKIAATLTAEEAKVIADLRAKAIKIAGKL